MEIMAFVKERKSKGVERGWGNGYVAVFESHPFYSKSFDDYIEMEADIIPFNGNIIGLFNHIVINGDKKKLKIDLLVNPHGGISYSEGYNKERHKNWITAVKFIEGNIEQLNIGSWWIFGFDTQYPGDNGKTWNEKAVVKETEKFLKQMKYWHTSKNHKKKDSGK